MKLVKLLFGCIFCILLLKSLNFYTCAGQTTMDTLNQVVDTKNDGSEEMSSKETERYNFDIASFLSLVGIGLLKFIDDKLKIKFREHFSVYRKCIICATTFFIILEAVIFTCFIFKWGATSFGNLKNIFLGLIPIVFCLLTLFTMKSEWNTLGGQKNLIINQKQLEKRINDFISCGMSPLGMIVGDMDFLGNVYNSKSVKGKKQKANITQSSQIKALIDNNIDKIQIVCKQPVSADDKRRIGYLLNILENRLQIKFFDETLFPIPKMRGRIMYKQSGQVVVITNKIKKKKLYEYSEHKVESLPGGLFADLWATIWRCSSEHPNILTQCKEEYISFMAKGENNGGSHKQEVD